jgi:hypothetical protein
MCKRQILQILLFNSLVLVCVPEAVRAAFEAPEPQPISFALGNLISFPDYMLQPTSGRWSIMASGARLYGLPDVQPFGFRASGRLLGGNLGLRCNGLKSGPYQETSAGLEYQHSVAGSFKLSLEAQVLQISITDYGSTWSGQFNSRILWTPPSFSLAFTWINVTGSTFGRGGYPLPQTVVLGGNFQPFHRLTLFMELEKTDRLDLTSRLGAGIQIFKTITLLAGLGSDPNLVSFGFSALIDKIRATAAYQYHVDLGFSQCYGIGVTF